MTRKEYGLENVYLRERRAFRIYGRSRKLFSTYIFYVYDHLYVYVIIIIIHIFVFIRCLANSIRYFKYSKFTVASPSDTYFIRKWFFLGKEGCVSLQFISLLMLNLKASLFFFLFYFIFLI